MKRMKKKLAGAHMTRVPCQHHAEVPRTAKNRQTAGEKQHPMKGWNTFKYEPMSAWQCWKPMVLLSCDLSHHFAQSVRLSFRETEED